MHDTEGLNLSQSEIDDLTEYVLSIGAENEAYGIEQIFATASDGATLYSKIAPGAVPDYFTVRKQDKYAREATVTITLADADGNSLESKSFELPAMKYGALYTVQFPSSFEIPEDFAEGGTLTFTITETRSGRAYATDLVLVNN